MLELDKPYSLKIKGEPLGGKSRTDADVAQPAEQLIRNQ